MHRSSTRTPSATVRRLSFGSFNRACNASPINQKRIEKSIDGLHACILDQLEAFYFVLFMQ